MRRNFEFDGFSVVKWDGRLIDLHNAYDLVAFGTDLRGDVAELKFVQNAYAIEPEALPHAATLRCCGNVRIAFNNLCEIAAPVADEGIEIAYFDEGCDWHSFLDEEIAKRQAPQGLHFHTINGLAVRIFCDEAIFATQ